ncbi:MAG: hypothetical protein AB7T06_08120 [Kofleriaceae bacterium]
MRWSVLLVLTACASASHDAPGGDDVADDAGVVDGDSVTDDGSVIPPDADPRRGWVDLGSPPGATSGDVSSPRIAMWNGAPVIAYSADKFVHVLAYENDSTWVPVGTPLRHSADANAVTYDPTPAVGADGLAVVWPEWSAGAMTSAVRRVSNGSWIAPPGAATLGTAGAYSFVPHSTAAIDADGSMWIAYAETTDINAPMRIFVVSLLGTNVYQRGQSISATNTNSGALAPTIAIGGGAQFMAWTENGVRVAKRNATTGAWDAFGGSPLTVAGRPASSQANPTMTVDAQGRPIVMFTSSNGTENGIYVARWSGTAWTYWGEMVQATPGTVGGQSTHPYPQSIVVGGPDLVYITWTEMDASAQEGVYVYRCTPGGCSAVGRGRLEAMTGATPGSWPSLAVDGAGRPIVSWVEDDASASGKARVWRYHGDPDMP